MPTRMPPQHDPMAVAYTPHHVQGTYTPRERVAPVRVTIPPSVVHSPTRMSLTNVATAETIYVAHNPEILDEEVQVSWNRLTVPGLSHQVLQYNNTNNLLLPAEFWWNGSAQMAAGNLRRDRLFLFSLCYPQGEVDSIEGSGPPRVLFVWPQMISCTCVVSGVKFTHTQFNYQGRSYIAKASVNFEEIRDFRLLSADVRANTQQRYSPPASTRPHETTVR